MTHVSSSVQCGINVAWQHGFDSRELEELEK